MMKAAGTTRDQHNSTNNRTSKHNDSTSRLDPPRTTRDEWFATTACTRTALQSTQLESGTTTRTNWEQHNSPCGSRETQEKCHCSHKLVPSWNCTAQTVCDEPRRTTGREPRNELQKTTTAGRQQHKKKRMAEGIIWRQPMRNGTSTNLRCTSRRRVQQQQYHNSTKRWSNRRHNDVWDLLIFLHQHHKFIYPWFHGPKPVLVQGISKHFGVLCCTKTKVAFRRPDILLLKLDLLVLGSVRIVTCICHLL